VVADLDVAAAPGKPWTGSVDLPAGLALHDVEVTVTGAQVALAYRAPVPAGEVVVPPPASEPPAPAAIASQEELFFTGEHLEQYRHPTRSPETYWQEALRRDPGDVRCNTALAHRWLKRGRAAEVVPLLRAAIARLTGRHPNPVDGEAHYLLGLALETLGHDDEAWAAHAKATWNAAWRGAASYRLACLAGRRGDHRQVLAFTAQALDANGAHQPARALRAAWLRRLGSPSLAGELAALRAANPLDHAAGHLEALVTGDRRGWQARTRRDPQTLLDVALDWADGGLLREAIDALEDAGVRDRTTLHALAWLHERAGDIAAATACRVAARTAPEPALFPVRPVEEALLRAAVAATDDPWPALMLGNYLHDKLRHGEAMAAWQTAVARDPACAPALRNLGIARHDHDGDPAAALVLYEQALAAAPGEARLLFELDQLARRLGQDPALRLARMLAHPTLVAARDDLTIEVIALLNRLGRHADARARLVARRFHPWEGGEGKVMTQHVATHLALARQALAAGDAATARTWAEAALADPAHLGEAKHLHAAVADIHWHLGRIARAAGDDATAQAWFAQAADARKDFSDMAVQAVSRMTLYQALALRDLGRTAEADAACARLEAHAAHLTRTPATIDYFATSLPDLLVFRVDPNLRQQVQAAFLAAASAVARGGGADILRQVLTLDPAHQEAASLLADLSFFTRS
jgi:tetratricopeptide (TPR) repeat protein